MKNLGLAWSGDTVMDMIPSNKLVRFRIEVGSLWASNDVFRVIPNGLDRKPSSPPFLLLALVHSLNPLIVDTYNSRIPSIHQFLVRILWCRFRLAVWISVDGITMLDRRALRWLNAESWCFRKIRGSFSVIFQVFQAFQQLRCLRWLS